jgi:hypothetical protein
MYFCGKLTRAAILIQHRNNRIIVFFLFACLWGNTLLAQPEENPFELTYRLKRQIAVLDPAVKANPFEILVRPNKNKVVLNPQPGATAFSPRPAAPRIRKPISPEAMLQRVKFGVVTGTLLFLAFLMTLLRNQVQKTAQAFLSDNWLNQLFREQAGRGILPFLLLYSLFMLNAGIFLFFLLRYFQVNLPGNFLLQISGCIGIIIIAFLLKHIVVSMIGYIFPVHKETERYNFLIIVFGIIIGLALVPINVLLAYGPPNIAPFLVFGALAFLGATYVFRTLRSLIIANRFLMFYQFHFLLYICTVEIAPILVGLKLALNFN